MAVAMSNYCWRKNLIEFFEYKISKYILSRMLISSIDKKQTYANTFRPF